MNVCKEMQEYIERYPYPGWYVDVQGAYCFTSNCFMIRIYYNKLSEFDDGDAYTITLEKVWGNTLDWDTSNDIDKIHYFVNKFMDMYM